MSLRESLLRQTEQAVDEVRKRRVDLEAELQVVQAEEDEAREMLRLLKNGALPPDKKEKPKLRQEDVLAILPDMPMEFKASDLAEVLDCTQAAASAWCKVLVKTGNLMVKVPGGPGSKPTVFRKV